VNSFQGIVRKKEGVVPAVNSLQGLVKKKEVDLENNLQDLVRKKKVDEDPYNTRNPLNPSLPLRNLVPSSIPTSDDPILVNRDHPYNRYQQDFNKGGAHGVGRSFVETICKKHAGLAKVIILDISEPTYSIPNVFWYKCNVGSRADVADNAERVKKEHGDPTMVVNNAGIVNAKNFVDLTGDEIVSFVVLIMV
jgi:hypothetical protein